jgi:glutaredoxin
VVKEFLSQLGVAFAVRDVNRDGAAREEFLRRGFRLPPVVLIGDQAIEGFAPQQIEDALEAAGAFDAR